MRRLAPVCLIKETAMAVSLFVSFIFVLRPRLVRLLRRAKWLQ